MGAKKGSKGWCGWFLVILILAIVACAIVITIKKRASHGGDDEAPPVPGPPGAIDSKYADALKLAVQFFDIQKCNPVSLTESSFVEIQNVEIACVFFNFMFLFFFFSNSFIKIYETHLYHNLFSFFF